jgi:TetR/AcrR family transcriptional repressor of nem operon
VARTKEFDPDVALQRALELFWARGYEATSMAELVEHLGIARASIYATFGGKHELFLKALDRYVRTTDPQVIAALSQPGPALPAVRALVRRYTDEAADDQHGLGCLVVNTAVELAPRDAKAARAVEASWSFLEAALTATLGRAQAQGELAPDRDPRAIARFLLVLLQGLRAMSRADCDPQRLRDATEQALTVLD